jgi:hypothetical protein
MLGKNRSEKAMKRLTPVNNESDEDVKHLALII